MSLTDPNAAAPANDQPAGVLAMTDEIEKKRIELKSMLSACVASGKLHYREKDGQLTQYLQPTDEYESYSF